MRTDDVARRADERAVGVWLALLAALVFAIVLVGGATRLTESGLSITEWKPVAGVLPPRTEGEWAEAFAKYQRIPQYRAMNADMTLEAFKRIYRWEFWHRIVARLAGVAFALPFLWFTLRGRMPRRARGRVLALVALTGVQGAMGWWMVSSGLTHRTEVSQYRLAAHLILALVIFALTVVTAADLLEGPRRPGADAQRRRSRALASLAALVLLTAFSGALVAGLRAGRIYNEFPLMGGRIAPREYAMLAPWWRNLFENPAAAQFDHRVLAVTTFLAALAAWAGYRRTADGRLRRRLDLVLAAATLQPALGIATLLLAVPVPLGVAHQGGAVLLLAATLLAWHASGQPAHAVAASPGPGAVEPASAPAAEAPEAVGVAMAR